MGFEALDYISIHKKSFPLSSKFVQQMEAKFRALSDLDAIRGSGLTRQPGALN